MSLTKYFSSLSRSSTPLLTCVLALFRLLWSFYQALTGFSDNFSLMIWEKANFSFIFLLFCNQCYTTTLSSGDANAPCFDRVLATNEMWMKTWKKSIVAEVVAALGALVSLSPPPEHNDRKYCAKSTNVRSMSESFAFLSRSCCALFGISNRSRACRWTKEKSYNMIMLYIDIPYCIRKKTSAQDRKKKIGDGEDDDKVKIKLLHRLLVICGLRFLGYGELFPYNCLCK